MQLFAHIMGEYLLTSNRESLRHPLVGADIILSMYATMGRFPEELMHKSRNWSTYFHPDGKPIALILIVDHHSDLGARSRYFIQVNQLIRKQHNHFLLPLYIQ